MSSAYATFRRHSRSRTLTLCVAASGAIALASSAAAQSIAGNNAPVMFPAAYAVATSGPSPSDGSSWVTVVDATGDTLAAAQKLIGTTVLGFALSSTGSFGNSLESDSSMNYFSGNANLLPGTVGVDTLPPNSCMSSVISSPNGIYTLDYKNNAIDLGLVSGGGALGEISLTQQASVGSTPITMTGNISGSRYAIVSQNVPYGVACNNIPTQVTSVGRA